MPSPATKPPTLTTPQPEKSLPRSNTLLDDRTTAALATFAAALDSPEATSDVLGVLLARRQREATRVLEICGLRPTAERIDYLLERHADFFDPYRYTLAPEKNDAIVTDFVANILSLPSNLTED